MKTAAKIQFLNEELKRVRELKSIKISKLFFDIGSTYEAKEAQILKELKALENKEADD